MTVLFRDYEIIERTHSSKPRFYFALKIFRIFFCHPDIAEGALKLFLPEVFSALT
ncbi:hypothetical protein jaqu_03510 [Jannaschia aquimarina]|uniref:Uncharacterized protein n=1 Tax=Jannaschia aquimarina TaxID=935700 RepID=A0A0D1EJY8_9RHOB|nr:hypothetical protein jaqu_03510 [Jannaschia aquimarina]SNT31466.1 hypothetical protein SAMN05421775_1113 [Jannaschia aquimarina]